MTKKLLVLLAGLLLSLGGIEGYLRLFNPQMTYDRLPKSGVGCFQINAIYFAAPKPNARCRYTTSEYDTVIRTNNQGFVALADIQTEKQKDAPRIVFIGDSYTFGQGVEQTENYPYLTGKILETNNVRSEIINASTIGAGVDWYYLRLKETLLTFNPDIVVVGVYLGNDLFDLDYFRWKEINSRDFPKVITTDHEYVDADGTRRYVTMPLRYKLQIVRNLHAVMFLAEKVFGAPGSPDKSIPWYGDSCMLRPDCRALDKNIDTTVSILEETDRLLTANHTKLLVVLIPWELQLPRTLLAKSKINFFATEKNRHSLSDKIATKLTDKHIPFIDLLPAFEAYAGTEPVFYPVDRHWTAAGHRIAAAALAPVIAEYLKGK